MIWPIDWPADADTSDAKQKALAELYAGQVLRMLTLYRVGGAPITVMPHSPQCGVFRGLPAGAVGVLGMPYRPYGRSVCACSSGCSCAPTHYVELDAPVGRIDAVRVGGVTVDPQAYHVEDGTKLVRTDGKGWPSCSRDFTVTYLNAYPVDILGAHVGGILADEFLKALRGDRKCRLPDGIQTITRAGMSIEFNEELFAGGVTGIREVDTWLRQWNPNGLKTMPKVYSIDKPRPRQITWRP